MNMPLYLRVITKQHVFHFFLIKCKLFNIIYLHTKHSPTTPPPEKKPINKNKIKKQNEKKTTTKPPKKQPRYINSLVRVLHMLWKLKCIFLSFTYELSVFTLIILIHLSIDCLFYGYRRQSYNTSRLR